MNRSKIIVAFLSVILGAGGATGWQSLTRENSTIVHTAPTTIVYNGKKSYIPEAVVWGNNKYILDTLSLLYLWLSEPRKTPAALMLLKAEKESGFRPFVARYEKGAHEVNPFFVNFTEFQSTSYGLFQVLGSNYPDSLKHKRGMLDIMTQLQQYDDFMYRCDTIQAKAPPNGKDRIYRMIACYGKTSKTGATSINALTESTYSDYGKWKTWLYQRLGLP